MFIIRVVVVITLASSAEGGVGTTGFRAGLIQGQGDVTVMRVVVVVGHFIAFSGIR